MKLVLSRKGFDSSYGGMASPILPDGTLVPLPIPNTRDAYRFADLNLATGIDLAALLADLSRGNHDLHTRIHLDPDLNRIARLRPRGWRPALGQTGAAQGHLKRMGVGIDDTFLFFGWFRQVERSRGRWRFSLNAPDLHVIFGWLEVADVLSVVSNRQDCLQRFPWIASHPHVVKPKNYTDPRNTLYIARLESRYTMESEFGGGFFPRLVDDLLLSRKNASRSYWSLPRWFMPSDGRTPLSYHGDQTRWKVSGNRVLLQTVAKGQEFVLNCDEYPETSAWVQSLVANGTAP